jgi:hypothetical protein
MLSVKIVKDHVVTLVPVRRLLLQILADHKKSGNAQLGVSSSELCARVYGKAEENLSRAQRVATRRALCALAADPAYNIERVGSGQAAFWRWHDGRRAIIHRPRLNTDVTPRFDQVSLLGRHRRSRRSASARQ